MATATQALPSVAQPAEPLPLAESLPATPSPSPEPAAKAGWEHSGNAGDRAGFILWGFGFLALALVNFIDLILGLFR
jgi:hypothetical protein